MENKTSKELRSSHSIRVLGGLRNTLQLQFSQMSSAWRDHNPEDGNTDTAVLARLDTIVESTRVAVAHVLSFSGDAIAHQVPWRPDKPFDPDACPNPYTSLAQFHRKVMPFAHRDSPHARQPPQPGGAAGRAGHMSYTPSSGRPDHVTRVVTSGGDGKATAHTTVPTRPNSMHVTKSAPAEASDRKGPEAALIFIGLSRRRFFPHVRVETFERLQDEVVLKRSTHAPASQPRRAWHATVANGQSISIGGQNNTGEHLSSKRPAKIEQLLLGRVPLKTRRTTSGASSTAPPTASVNPCNRPRAKSVKSRAEVSSNGEVQATDRRPDVQRLDQPDTLLRCHLCP